MPYELRTQAALAALRQPIAEFRSAVHDALTQADAFLAAQSAGAPERAAQAAAELGLFGAAHIDAFRFAALFPAVAPASAPALDALRAAIAVMRSVALHGDALFVTEVTDGHRLGAAIDAALAPASRAFGAIVVTELVRGGRYDPVAHGGLLDATGFREWNRAERRFAPPLVVELDGVDLYAGALLDFADGREKIILVVRDEAAPAPLVRCITAGTFVLQTVDGAGLDRVARFDGPAIAALMPAGAATFRHDPAAGSEMWQRLAVGPAPIPPTRAVGGFSTWQMREDLALLADMARTPFTVPGANGGKGAPAFGADDAVDRIANWLLDASGLAGG